MKKMVWVMAAAALCLSLLTACGNSEKKAAQSSSAGKVTLELWLQKTNVVEQFTEIISRFEAENPDIHIELTSVPDPETALVSRIAANDYPDIITIWPAEKFYRDLMRDGALLDISKEGFMNRVAGGPRSIAQYGGKDYSLSVAMSAYGMLVNKKLFRDNNLEYPTTWDELLKVCRAFESAGIQPFTFYGKSTEQVGQMGERMSGIIDNDITATISLVGQGKTTWQREPQMRQLAAALVELHKHGQKDVLGADYDAAFNDMTTEKAAMMIYGSWGVQRLLNMNPNLEIEMIPIPNPTGGKNTVPASIDTALAISTASKNPAAALKFLDFFSTAAIAQWYADNEKNPPVIEGVVYNVPPLMLMADTLNSGAAFFTPSVYWPAGFRTSWEAPIQALIDPLGRNDIEAFLKSTNDICVEYFRDYDYQ
ncbi:ABC transporter substrate-binding protein [Breznakiella homolactica]|uniref:Extracellular solute-binding protein n=1 Tax=Breznakiella homolactica TaxID=2798577 RepID=A0A7T7XMX4_9SPIR|nr:extracellular solute-binding protein [Breznakiella homolactica]QQO09299.1 extracellular solute-binding protein [Breznakiella homolactica]